MAFFNCQLCILKLSCIYFYLVFPQVLPLPFFLHPAGVGLHEGYLALFSPSFLPHVLYPVILPSLRIGALQSTHPPSLPGAPLRLNQVRSVSFTFSSISSSVTLENPDP